MSEYLGRTRLWGLLLYTDNENHMLALELIKNNYEYIYIIHNKDYIENEPKKEHIHLIIEFPNARYKKPIASELGISTKWVRPIRYIDNALLYLVHANSNNKYQYEVSDLIGTKRLKDKFHKATDRQDYRSETEKLELIFQWLEKNKKYKLNNLIQYCLENKLYSEFRRNYIIIKDLSAENYYSYMKNKVD